MPLKSFVSRQWAPLRIAGEDRLLSEFLAVLMVATSVAALAVGFLDRPSFPIPFFVIVGLGAALSVLLNRFGWALPHYVWLNLLVGYTIMLGVLIALGGESEVLGFFFVLVSIATFYFFNTRSGVLLSLLAATSFITSSVLADGLMTASIVVHGLGLLLAMGVCGILVRLLKLHAAEVIDDLDEEVHTDALTGLINRRGFTELMEREIMRAENSRGRLALILCDLDYFKKVNDTWGHPVGDHFLCLFSQVIRAQARSGDIVARLGGEEFALALPGSDMQGALYFAERLRVSVGKAFAAEGYQQSASFGVAVYPEQALGVDQLIDCADNALYLAKETGRDRVVAYQEEVVVVVDDPALLREQAEKHLQAALVLARALDIHEGVAHASHTGDFAAMIATEMGLSAPEAERLRVAGVLADIGKLGIPEQVLAKAGELTEAERAELERHAERGASLLVSLGHPDLASWIAHHHERVDGRGYPAGLADEEISLEARILAVADAYESMISTQAWREAKTPEEAQGELVRGAGTQWDPAAVDALLRALRAKVLRRRHRQRRRPIEDDLKGPRQAGLFLPDEDEDRS